MVEWRVGEAKVTAANYKRESNMAHEQEREIDDGDIV